LERRVEILFPLEKDEIKQKAIHILQTQLSDNTKAHMLNKEGIYDKINRRGAEGLTAQDVFCKEASEAIKFNNEKEHGRVFIPKVHVE